MFFFPFLFRSSRTAHGVVVHKIAAHIHMYQRSVAFGLIAVWDQYSWRSAISFHHEHDALDKQTLAELRGQDRDSNRLLIRSFAAAR